MRTIGEKVVALQDKKRDLFARVIDDGNLPGAADHGTHERREQPRQQGQPR